MTLWIIWSMLVSGLVALAAAAVERAAAYLNAPRRFVWIGAMVMAAVAPFAFALRYGPVVPKPVITSYVRDSAQHDALGASVQVSAAVPMMPAARVVVLPLRQRIVSTVRIVVEVIDPWVVRLWLVASLTLLIVFCRELLRLRRQRVHWREADLDSCMALVAVDAGPAVVGFAHPRIVVPEWALSLDRSARSLLLRHETEHIRAGDPRTLLGGLLLLVAFPWNAALWWMSHRLRLAIEIDCDARVIRAVGATRDYGMVLLAVSERFAKPLPFAASLVEPRLTLERRIKAMSAPRQRRPLLAALPCGLAALVAITAAARAPRPAPILTIEGSHTVPTLSQAAIRAAAPTTAIDEKTEMSKVTSEHRSTSADIADVPPGMAGTGGERPIAVRGAIPTMPNCDALTSIIADNFSTDLSAFDATPPHERFPEEYVVLVFDANNNYLRGIYGTGTLGLRVAGDARPASERPSLGRHLECGDPVAAAQATLQGLVRADGQPVAGGRGGDPARRAAFVQWRVTADTVIMCCAPWRVEPFRVPGGGVVGDGWMAWERLFLDDHASDSYVVGIEQGATGLLPGGPLTLAPNQPPGLTQPVPDSSGIAGIPASSVSSIDRAEFASGQLGSTGFDVYVVTLTPGSPHE